jgi:hypothetical protein
MPSNANRLVDVVRMWQCGSGLQGGWIHAASKLHLFLSASAGGLV